MIDECLIAEFLVRGDDCPLARASKAAETAVDARPPQLRSDGNVLLRFSAPSGSGLAEQLDVDDDIRYLHRASAGDRRNFRCLSKRPCVVHELVDAGFLVDSMRYERGNATMTGAVVGHDVLQGVMERAAETVGVNLRRLHPLSAEDEAVIGRGYGLTPAQQEGLQTAYEMGYFAVPKACTAAEVADELGISKSALLERIRRGQEALFGALLAP